MRVCVFIALLCFSLVVTACSPVSEPVFLRLGGPGAADSDASANGSSATAGALSVDFEVSGDVAVEPPLGGAATEPAVGATPGGAQDAAFCPTGSFSGRFSCVLADGAGLSLEGEVEFQVPEGNANGGVVPVEGFLRVIVPSGEVGPLGEVTLLRFPAVPLQGRVECGDRLPQLWAESTTELLPEGAQVPRLLEGLLRPSVPATIQGSFAKGMFAGTIAIDAEPGCSGEVTAYPLALVPSSPGI